MAADGPRSPKRVLLLARGGPLDGSQRQLLYLVRNLDRSRYEPVAILDRPGALADGLGREGVEASVVRMRPWRSFPTGLLRLWDAFRIARWGRQRGAALVHASDVWKCGYVRSVARRLGIPGVLHIRGVIPPGRIVKHKVAQADAILVIARRYEDDLLAADVPPSKVTVIDDAVDLDQFRPGLPGRDDFRRRLGIDARVAVGLVGRVEPRKRVLEFLEAAAPLARRPDCRAAFVVIGRAKGEEYIQAAREAARRHGIEHSVIFAGHCADMPGAMSALDLLVTMSGGSVMFEAMGCAKPVLSVRVDGRHSVHTRHDATAWCVTADSPGPVTSALERLIDDGALRDRLGQAGRAWAQEHLSPAAMAAKTQAVYDRLLGP